MNSFGGSSALDLHERTVLRYVTLIKWTRLPLSGRVAIYRRPLSCLLLALLAYGSTIAAAHSHGYLSSDRSGTAAITDPGGSHPSDKRHSRQAECSICQFHQQLFKGLVHTSLLTPTCSAQLSSACASPVGYSSISATAQRGRGPPFTSLV